MRPPAFGPGGWGSTFGLDFRSQYCTIFLKLLPWLPSQRARGKAKTGPESALWIGGRAVIENLGNLFASYTEYMKQAGTELESLRGPLPPDEQETFGVKLLDFDSFCEFWDRVCCDAALRERWLRRLEHGFAHEKTRVSRMVDELLRVPEVLRKDAAA